MTCIVYIKTRGKRENESHKWRKNRQMPNCRTEKEEEEGIEREGEGDCT